MDDTQLLDAVKAAFTNAGWTAPTPPAPEVPAATLTAETPMESTETATVNQPVAPNTPSAEAPAEEATEEASEPVSVPTDIVVPEAPPGA